MSISNTVQNEKKITLATPLSESSRSVSLDVFRGITICLMIIVNSPGKGADMFPFLVHARWFGFTLADLVFPSFLFAVGNSMSFSMRKLDNVAAEVVVRKILYRAALIFIIGFLMYWFPFVHRDESGIWQFNPIGQTRIMGVLQRIAISYLVASLIVYYLSFRTSVIIALGLLLLYWVVLYVFGAPGSELEMTGNAVTRLDLFLLGEGHVYRKDLVPFDPEGVLSTLPAIVNVLAGYWAGRYLLRNQYNDTTVSNLFMMGVITVVAALGWSLLFPISKKLWTSSFAVYTIGIDVIALAVLVFAVEVRQWKINLDFFKVFGRNPLFIYLFSELLYITMTTIRLNDDRTVFDWVSYEIFQRLAPGSLGSFITAVAFMLVCWCVGWELNRRKIYIRI